VIGAKILFGRERSSAYSDDPVFVRELISRWGPPLDEAQYSNVLLRARAAVATSYDRHYITVEELRAIYEGVIGA